MILEWKVGPREPDNVQFGMMLEEMRKQLGLSRAEVAGRLGLSSEYFRLIERGERVPAEGHFRHILDVYQIPYEIVEGRWHIASSCIEFTSRIKEVRGAPGQLAPRKPVPRLVRMGLIMDLLVNADEATLKDVHTRLRRSRRNPGV